MLGEEQAEVHLGKVRLRTERMVENLKGIWGKKMKIMPLLSKSGFFVIVYHIFAMRGCVYTLDLNQRRL